MTAAAFVTLAGLVAAFDAGLVTLPAGASPSAPATPAPATARPNASSTEPPAASGAPGFAPAGSLMNPRVQNFAVLLRDGSVLAGAGRGPLLGDSHSSAAWWNTTERWSPETDEWAASAPLGSTGDVVSGQISRANQPAFTLPDGRVLIVPAGCACSPQDVLHAEIWSDAGGTASVETSPSLSLARVGHSVTLLADGRILIAGGAYELKSRESTPTAEVWDPVRGTVTATGSMQQDRIAHVATLLADGRVLVLGGVHYSDREPVLSAEVWDPKTGSFTPVESLRGIAAINDPIDEHPEIGDTRVLTLHDGRVVILDGRAARLWEPRDGALVNAGAFIVPRAFYTATLLPGDQVLIAGGLAGDGPIGAAEVWDPATLGFADAGTLLTPRSEPTATALLDGRVLVAGGWSGSTVLGTAEIWSPTNGR